MGDGSALTPQVLAQIGKESPALVIEIEKGEIRRFAEAVGDLKSWYMDETAAAQSVYGGIVAPPTFVYSLLFRATMPRVELDFGSVSMNGGNEFDFFKPIRLGDRITVTTKVADIYEKLSRNGHLVFTVYETSYVNQNGETVAVSRTTGIRK